MPILKNIRHEKFCQEYVKTGNATESAAKAGYSKKTANEQAGRLLVNVSIKKRISELQSEIKEKYDKEVDHILEGLKKIIRIGLEEYKVKLKNSQTITKLVDPKNAKSALDSWARMEGRFQDKMQLEGTSSFKVEVLDATEI